MKSNALRRCPVIVPIAAIVASISVSGCHTMTAQPVAMKARLPSDQTTMSVETEPPSDQATTSVEAEPPSDEATTPGGEGDFERALSLAAAERHSEAREVLDPLLKREPDHGRARVLHGVLRAREGRVGDAIEIFETLRRDYPDMSEPYNNLAVLYTVEDRLDDARRILLESLERRPDAVTYANLGEVYTKLAQAANERARELDAGVVASLKQ